MDALADGLCKVRGAGLKLGQMLSLQDEETVPPVLLKALERVRNRAEAMPHWQVHEVLSSELGSAWRERLVEFDETPFAAASIGQVHRGRTAAGVAVAVKVQYPGVRESIGSDISNLRRVVRATGILPPGLFAEHGMGVMRRELDQECDYVEEARKQRLFGSMLEGSPRSAILGPVPHSPLWFRVPKVIDDLSSERVLTTEFLPGEPVEAAAALDQATRDNIAFRLLVLTLRELFEFRLMQTDASFANFLYDGASDTLGLIDFGAAREYPLPFVMSYLEMVDACAKADRDRIIAQSVELGFLTGFENEEMLKAHVESARIVGEPFSAEGCYDFAGKRMAKRVAEQGQIMLAHRLTPPPEEAYTLHRKLSGTFLTCARLNASVPVKDLWTEVYARAKGHLSEQKKPEKF
jgi:aarF domain-containing kinase